MSQKEIMIDKTDLDVESRLNNNFNELYDYKEAKEVEITNTDFDSNYTYTLNHGLGYPIDLRILDNDDYYVGYSQVSVKYVDDNNVQIEFGEPISGTYKLKYNTQTNQKLLSTQIKPKILQ